MSGQSKPEFAHDQDGDRDSNARRVPDQPEEISFPAEADQLSSAPKPHVVLIAASSARKKDDDSTVTDVTDTKLEQPAVKSRSFIQHPAPRQASIAKVPLSPHIVSGHSLPSQILNSPEANSKQLLTTEPRSGPHTPTHAQEDHSPPNSDVAECEGESESQADLPSSESRDYEDDQIGGNFPQQVADKSYVLFNQLHEMVGHSSKHLGAQQTTLVGAGCFPSSGDQFKRGRLFYSADKILVPNVFYWIRETQALRLGRGGNSEVFVYFRNDKYYAVKKSKYQKSVLNIWSLLDHPNIARLLGVVMGEFNEEEQAYYCYHFMAEMTGNLHSMTSSDYDIVTLLQRNPEYQHMQLVLHNIVFIIKAVLKGLVKLDELNILHGDIKADNILVKKWCACSDLLHCSCPEESKYSVQIADFDSVISFSPEVAKAIKNKLYGGMPRYDLMGTWSDIWDLGAMLVELVLGSDRMNTCIEEARALAPQNDQVDPDIKRMATKLLLGELFKLGLKHKSLKPLIQMACCCLEVDGAKRLTASELLKLK